MLMTSKNFAPVLSKDFFKLSNFLYIYKLTSKDFHLKFI